MFKVGDKVICIDNSNFGNNRDVDLVLEKIYTVTQVYRRNTINWNKIKIDNQKITWFTKRFITNKEYRKLKLEKLDEKKSCL